MIRLHHFDFLFFLLFVTLDSLIVKMWSIELLKSINQSSLMFVFLDDAAK